MSELRVRIILTWVALPIPKRASTGAAITVTGAVLLACAIAVLVYGLCTEGRDA
jgi:hypothetical protein